MITPIGQSPLRCPQFVIRRRVRKDKVPLVKHTVAGIVSAANSTVSERTSSRHVSGTRCRKSVQPSSCVGAETSQAPVMSNRMTLRQ
jgi:hypothetical protein